MRRKFVYIGLLLISATVLLYSCSKGYNSSPDQYNSQGMPGGSVAMVAIQNMAFMPDTLSVKMGTTVVWTNTDGMPHTVVDLSGRFASGTLASGQTYAYAFTMVGMYTYYCSLHPEMKAGVILVTN